MATNGKSPVTRVQNTPSGTAHPTSAYTSHQAVPINHMTNGEDLNGDWPADGFILPGTSTADQKAGRGHFVQGSNGRGQHGWKGGK